jgi:predicted Zn finger-like uncharacterized protein
MVIVCQQCAARLQLDDSKIPARAFTVRCPKCQHLLNAQPPSAQQAPAPAGAAGLSEPAAQSSRLTRPMPAPAFRLDGAAGDGADAADPLRGDRDEITNLLSALLQRALTTAATQASQSVAGRGWEGRCVLVCAAPEWRFSAARVLVESGYEVYVAEDTTQAIERMRENKMDVVLLDPTFDAVEQGAAFIKREISALRPAARRRVFVVLLSAELRTGDPHHAFVNHSNMALNPADLEELPLMLDRGIRDFNGLYRDFNKALQLSDF